MGWTRVRMVKGETHGIVAADDYGHVCVPYIGRFIRVELPPRTPDAGWFCGTRNVWRVHSDDVSYLLGRPVAIDFFVCEHQIEID